MNSSSPSLRLRSPAVPSSSFNSQGSHTTLLVAPPSPNLNALRSEKHAHDGGTADLTHQRSIGRVVLRAIGALVMVSLFVWGVPKFFFLPPPDPILRVFYTPDFSSLSLATRQNLVKEAVTKLKTQGVGSSYSTEALTWRRRDEFASLLCMASLSARPCSLPTTTPSKSFETTSQLGYQLAPPSLSHLITAVLPADLPSLPLLINLFLSLTYQNPLLSNLFDVIWIVVPSSDVQAIYEGLMKANAFPLVGRVIAEDILLPKGGSISGWFTQQEVKLAISIASRTDYYLTLDADIMAGRTLKLRDFISQDGRGYIASTRAGGFWAYESGNLKRACVTLGVSCEEFNEESVITAFTPVLFHTHVVYSLLKELDEKGKRVKEGGDWISFLEATQLENDGTRWTEYLLYMLHAKSQKAYNSFHIPILDSNTYVEEGTNQIPEFFSQSQKVRSAWLNINDNRKDVDVKKVRRELLTGIALSAV